MNDDVMAAVQAERATAARYQSAIVVRLPADVRRWLMSQSEASGVRLSTLVRAILATAARGGRTR